LKKILILTAGFGEGHNSAARGIRQGLAEVGNGRVQVQVHDIFSDTYGAANDWVREVYLGLINNVPQLWAAVYRCLDRQEKFAGNFRVFFTAKKRLRRLLGEFEPDVIVSVYPAYPHMLDEMFGAAGNTGSKHVVVITDSLTVNAIWYRCSADYFLLPNDRSATVLHEAGISPRQIRTFGFPVSPEFAEVVDGRRSPSDAHGRRVLYLINARKSGAAEMVYRLTSLNNIQLTVAVGRDRRMRKAVESIRTLATRRFDIVGWSEELPRLLSTSHILISKAGGAIVQEAMAAACPMIVNHIIPGQEEGNARLLVEANCGAIALTPGALVRTIQSVFANNAACWQEWSTNIAQLSRPGASLDIARFLLSL